MGPISVGDSPGGDPPVRVGHVFFEADRRSQGGRRQGRADWRKSKTLPQVPDHQIAILNRPRRWPKVGLWRINRRLYPATDRAPDDRNIRGGTFCS
jgi:hypothetical protein